MMPLQPLSLSGFILRLPRVIHYATWANMYANIFNTELVSLPLFKYIVKTTWQEWTLMQKASYLMQYNIKAFLAVIELIAACEMT
jgi:hypothetical protein